MLILTFESYVLCATTIEYDSLFLERFGHVFLWDSGSSVGEIMGHSKFINAIDYRPVRPFRVVTAGEDKKLGYFEGPPFRYKRAMDVSLIT